MTADWCRGCCPNCGRQSKRAQTDDGYVYVFVMVSIPLSEPRFDGGPFDRSRKVAIWAPVDQYTGGIERTTMHLIYTLFHQGDGEMELVDFHRTMPS